MNILGLSAFVHDSGACLIKNGELIANIEEERFNREKHTDAFPINSINYVLKAGGISLSEIDVISFNWNPWKSFWAEVIKFLFFPTIYLKIQNFHKPPKNFKSIWASFRIRQKINQYFPDAFKGGFHCIEHHLCHAASSYFLSPFKQKNAMVLVVDGHGDDCSATVFRVQDGKHFRKSRTWSFLNSLGILYSNFTRFLGFDEYQDGKTMALASYGKNTYSDYFRQVIALNNKGGYRIPKKRFLGLWNYTEKGLSFRLGRPRKKSDPIEQRHYDIAHSMQHRVKEALLNVIRYMSGQIASDQPKNLCLAGGVFLNCDINREILSDGGFDQIFIPPFTSDCGGAAGSALYTAFVRLGEPFPQVNDFSPFLGPEYDDQSILHALYKRNLKYTESSKPWIKTAEGLQRGQVIGWFQGRVESGPRALGNRSILANPSTPDICCYLNKTIKLREEFRPFAPIATQEAAIRYFEMPQPIPVIAHYMLVTVKVRKEYQQLLPGITHIDGSARIQVVTRESNLFLHNLLVEFGKLSGFEVLINTSFNRHEPMVCSPEDAADCFIKTGLDKLVMGKYIVNKENLYSDN